MHGHDFESLDALRLLPRVIHNIEEADPGWNGLGIDLPGPLWTEVPSSWSGRITYDREQAQGAILLVPPLRMKALVPLMREAGTTGALAVGVDFSLLHTQTTGNLELRPRSASDLAELKDAAGLPFVAAGLLDPRDATLASEAGADVLIACSRLSGWLGGPPLAELIPDILDAAGETLILARGGIRNGADVLRLLALGAAAVVVPAQLNPHHLLEEFTHVMRLTGCSALEEINYDLIFEPTFN